MLSSVWRIIAEPNHRLHTDPARSAGEAGRQPPFD